MPIPKGQRKRFAEQEAFSHCLGSQNRAEANQCVKDFASGIETGAEMSDHSLIDIADHVKDNQDKIVSNITGEGHINPTHRGHV